MLLFASCGKNDKANPSGDTVAEGVVQKTETSGGITYRLFTKEDETDFRGILVTGSGNDENNPAPGALNGAAETDLCQTAAKNGYVAAIVQYRKTEGNANWNASAKAIGEDYDKCIVALSAKFNIDKTRSVVAGFSYSSFMLLTDIALNNTLSYSKGLLAACGGADSWKAQNFKIPVFSINCSGNNEGDYNGIALYNQIPDNSPIKVRSGGVTDESCNGHCGGNWTRQMYDKLNEWLQ